MLSKVGDHVKKKLANVFSHSFGINIVAITVWQSLSFTTPQSRSITKSSCNREPGANSKYKRHKGI